MIGINIDKSVIDSDKFLDMPKTTQLLYFNFLFEADTDGYVNNFKAIIRSNGFAPDDLNILFDKEFIQEGNNFKGEFCFVIIKDWNRKQVG